MKKRILFGLCILFCISLANAAVYVKDHNNCAVSYQSQDCTGSERLCAYVSSTVYCEESATVNSTIPATVTQVTSTNYNSTLGGGYVYQCDYSTNSNCNTWLCQRDTSCYGVNRYTNCTANNHGFVCDTCLTGYAYCDGSFTDADGCEVTIGSTAYPAEANAAYNSSCQPACTGTYLDCDADLGSAGTGCEVNNGGACTVGSLAGTYSGCTCSLTKSYFQTETFIEYLNNWNAMLWFKNWGTGWLINATNSKNETWGVDNESCMVLKDGTRVCDSSDLGVGTSSSTGGNRTLIIADECGDAVCNTLLEVEENEY